MIKIKIILLNVGSTVTVLWNTSVKREHALMIPMCAALRIVPA
jgi:hypothetical protein